MAKLLITKDSLRKDQISFYNPYSYFKTPNIDRIAKEGFALHDHYTTAPSTAMALTSIITGNYPNNLNRKRYQPEENWTGKTLFDMFLEKGINSIMFVPDYWSWFKEYINAFENLSMHYYKSNLVDGISPIMKQIEALDSKDYFVWIHLPHVLAPFTGLGSDIESFDNLVGELDKLNYFDETIVTSDHGHFRFEKNLILYGFDLYQKVINVPFIASNRRDKSSFKILTSHKYLLNYLVDNELVDCNYVIAETAYSRQIGRKMCLVTDRYKLIASLRPNKDELYDLKLDEEENWNLLLNTYKDKNRHKTTSVFTNLYYPHDAEISNMYRLLSNQLKSEWTPETSFSLIIIYLDSLIFSVFDYSRIILRKLYNIFKR